MMLAPLLGFVVMAVFLMLFVGKKSRENVAGGPARTRQTLDKIRRVDEHFSLETFIGNLSNKLLSICYAGSAREIEPFAVCDMTPLLARYRGVIDCKLLECVLMDYQADDHFQHLRVNCDASLSLLNGGKCAYCGQGLDLKEYDWVIEEYQPL